MKNQAPEKEPGRIKSLLDKYRSLAIVTVLILTTCSTFAQVRFGVRQKNLSKGIDFKEVRGDSLLGMPRDTLPLLAKDSGAVAYKGGITWVFDGVKWDTLSGRAGITTFYKDSTIGGDGTIDNPLTVVSVGGSSGGGGDMFLGTVQNVTASKIFSSAVDPIVVTGATTSSGNVKDFRINFDTTGAPIFRVTAGSPLPGHSSAAMFVQNTLGTSGGYIGFWDNYGNNVGEVGPSNIDSNFHVIANFPEKMMTIGLHPISDGTHLNYNEPLQRFERNGTIKLINIDEATLSTLWNAKLDVARQHYIWGDTLDIVDATENYLMQIKGSTVVAAPQPVVSLFSNGITTPFTFDASSKLSARIGANEMNYGGMKVQGWSVGDHIGMRIQGHTGSTAPSAYAPITMEAFKSNGSNSRTGVASTESALRIFNGNVDSANTKIADMKGNGDLAIAGSFKVAPSGDGFLSNNAVFGVHSNGYAYFQGNTGGFILANNNTRTEQIQIRSAEHEARFFTNNNERLRIDSNGAVINYSLAGTGKRSVNTLSTGQIVAGFGVDLAVLTTGTTYTIPENIGSVFWSYSTGVTLNLPNPASYPGRSIKIRNGTSGTMTLGGYSFFYYQGAANATSLATDHSVTLQSDGTQWLLIDSNFTGTP